MSVILVFSDIESMYSMSCIVSIEQDIISEVISIDFRFFNSLKIYGVINPNGRNNNIFPNIFFSIKKIDPLSINGIIGVKFIGRYSRFNLCDSCDITSIEIGNSVTLINKIIYIAKQFIIISFLNSIFLQVIFKKINLRNNHSKIKNTIQSSF